MVDLLSRYIRNKSQRHYLGGHRRKRDRVLLETTAFFCQTCLTEPIVQKSMLAQRVSPI